MLSDYLSVVLFYVLPALSILGLLNALHAIMRVRSPRGVIAWVFALVTIPLLAIPFYWVFGRYRFMGYVRARRAGNARMNHIVQQVSGKLRPFLPEDEEDYALLGRLAGLPMTRSNALRLLVNGEETYAAMHAAMEAAEHYLLVQFFIVRDDASGRAFAERLCARAREGLQVLFLYDQLGSRDLPASYLDRLKEAGVQVIAFRSSRGRGNRFQINFRNHRKVLIADGRKAFVGGLNLGEEYLGRHPRLGLWRDTHVQIEGPAVQAIQLTFIEDWFWAAGDLPERLEWTPTPAPDGANQSVLPIPSGPADELETCHLLFLEAIHSATHRLWITSPYFVPDHGLTAALQLAALRGVDVRILLPERADHLLVYLSSFSYLEEMEQAGVRIYRYQPGFMHQKVALVDNRWAAVGTANLDNRSMYLNFEFTLLCPDPGFVKDVELMLRDDLDRCRRVSADEFRHRRWPFRLAVRLARVLSPLQ